MKIVKFSEVDAVDIPNPYERHIKVLLAPDRHDVDDITLSLVNIPPNSQTDYHHHDRPELIVVLSGKGKSICNGEEILIEADMALWVLAGEEHKIINDQDETIKLLTVFTPGYPADELLGTILKSAQKK